MTFDPKDMLGVIDLRFLGYYKIKQGVLQQHLSCMYHFESVNTVCDQFNRLMNILRKEEETNSTDKYPWLDDSDERKYHDIQENIRQVHRFREFLFNKTGKAKK